MTEQEIATAVAKGVEAAIKPLGEKITALETRISDAEKTTATATAKAAVARHVARGAIAPQDADTIAHFETAYATNADGTEKVMSKLPVTARRRVIPDTAGTATASASSAIEALDIADEEKTVLTASAKLGEARKLPTTAAALDAYLHSAEGNAAYADILRGRDGKRRDVAAAR